MINAGLSEADYMQPEIVANFFTHCWRKSGKSRTSGIVICTSATGLYHAHMALYGNTTTLSNVSKILFDSHVEPQIGGKKELISYLLKEGDHAEKGETVLYTQGLENIQDKQGARSDIEEIEELLHQGLSPVEIMEQQFSYRRYERMIKSAYIDMRIRETPPIKEIRAEWHVGNSGCGKTHMYKILCEKYSPEQIYLTSDNGTGAFDFYIEQGAPPIIFIDEFKGRTPYGELLNILDKYSRIQTHCRYNNTYNLWTQCYITSIFPPEEAYSYMVEDSRKYRDSITQLIRRLTVIVYHYKTKTGEYKTYSISAEEYTNYDDLKKRALADKDGFISLNNNEEAPFLPTND